MTSLKACSAEHEKRLPHLRASSGRMKVWYSVPSHEGTWELKTDRYQISTLATLLLHGCRKAQSWDYFTLRRLGRGQVGIFYLSSMRINTLWWSAKTEPDSYSLYSQMMPTHLISLPWQHSPSSNLMQCHFAIQQRRILETKGAGGTIYLSVHM